VKRAWWLFWLSLFHTGSSLDIFYLNKSPRIPKSMCEHSLMKKKKEKKWHLLRGIKINRHWTYSISVWDGKSSTEAVLCLSGVVLLVRFSVGEDEIHLSKINYQLRLFILLGKIIYFCWGRWSQPVEDKLPVEVVHPVEVVRFVGRDDLSVEDKLPAEVVRFVGRDDLSVEDRSPVEIVLSSWSCSFC